MFNFSNMDPKYLLPGGTLDYSTWPCIEGSAVDDFKEDLFPFRS